MKSTTKYYKVYRIDGDLTLQACKALEWHRKGVEIIVETYHNNHMVKAITVHGAPQKNRRNADDENRRHCKHIAQTLDIHAEYGVIRCPECGEDHNIPDNIGDKFRCPSCGTVFEVDDAERPGVWDYLSDVYDIEYRIGSDKQYRSVRVMVACGGPNIYLNTASGDVELYWWTESARYPMSRAAIDAVDCWAEDLWGCM